MGVLAVALFEGSFARRVVDPRYPQLRKAFGENDGRHELGEYLQDVDEGLPGGEEVQEGLGNSPVGEPNLIAQSEDKSPVITASLVGVWRDVACLVLDLAFQEEGVGVDGGFDNLRL